MVIDHLLAVVAVSDPAGQPRLVQLAVRQAARQRPDADPGRMAGGAEGLAAGVP